MVRVMIQIKHSLTMKRAQVKDKLCCLLETFLMRIITLITITLDGTLGEGL
ncbi:uncharacterized protein DS421_14g464210 [Arachis hypogaea]|nr:uncharacterized protein DS421_14g464210 [Arachis hypogaea]